MMEATTTKHFVVVWANPLEWNSGEQWKANTKMAPTAFFVV